MKALIIALAVALLDFNVPDHPAADAQMYVVELPCGVNLFVSDNATPETVTDDFVFDFDVRG